LNREFLPARLVRRDAQKMPGIGVVRLDRKDLAIDLLGLWQPAGLMVGNRRCQCFRHRRHRRDFF